MTRLLEAMMALLGANGDNERGTAGVNASELGSSLNGIGDAWRCWRMAREPDRDFAFRLGVHLQALVMAIEDDLEQVLAAERAIVAREKKP